MTLKEIKEQRQTFDQQTQAMYVQIALLRGLTQKLQAECPHPFEYAMWNEIIPAGRTFKGYCGLCGGVRWASDYTKEQMKNVTALYVHDEIIIEFPEAPAL